MPALLKSRLITRHTPLPRLGNVPRVVRGVQRREAVLGCKDSTARAVPVGPAGKSDRLRRTNAVRRVYEFRTKLASNRLISSIRGQEMSVKDLEPGKMQRILLAEDDEDMRKFLVKALENAGYAVVSFSNGAEAYDRLKEEPFTLLLTDIVMPEMDGIELARLAADLDPDLKIMFITGFAAVALNPDNQAPKDAKVLSKPFHLRDLVLCCISGVPCLASRPSKASAISSLKNKEHLGLLEKFEMNEAGELKRSFARAGLNFDANLKPELEEYVKKGLIGNEVWVTPGLPFMLSITAGFVAAVVFGDLLSFYQDRKNFIRADKLVRRALATHKMP